MPVASQRPAFLSIGISPFLKVKRLYSGYHHKGRALDLNVQIKIYALKHNLKKIICQIYTSLLTVLFKDVSYR